MSRFVNLELDGHSEDHSHEQKGLLKDESYYLAEARSAFENGNFESALRFYSKVLEFNPENAAAWTHQVRMLIELGEGREAKLWADKALERFPHEPELLAAKPSRWRAAAICKGRWPFRMPRSKNAAIRLTSGWPGGLCCWPGKSSGRLLLREGALLAPKIGSPLGWRQGFGIIMDSSSLALKLVQRSDRNGTRAHFVLWLQQGQCQQALGLLGPAKHSFTQARQLNPRCSEAEAALVALSQPASGDRMRGWGRRLSRQ